MVVDGTTAPNIIDFGVAKALSQKLTRCKPYYEPVPIKRLAGPTFGHAFRAWAIYQPITLRLPYRTITQAMEDLFHETASQASIVGFMESFAEHSRRTESILVKCLRESPFAHVDETRLSIRGVDHYVWVFTDVWHVVFRMTETRETTVVRAQRASRRVARAYFCSGWTFRDRRGIRRKKEA
jgi:hypothetical protein